MGFWGKKEAADSSVKHDNSKGSTKGGDSRVTKSARGVNDGTSKHKSNEIVQNPNCGYIGG